MREVYNGYEEMFISGKKLKEMFEKSFFCTKQHHATILDITIPEVLEQSGIVDEKEYRVFYNKNFCKVLDVNNDKHIAFFSHITLEGTQHAERYLKRPKCPYCGGNMLPYEGKYGWFWSCVGYPQCKGSKRVLYLGNFGWGGIKICNIDKDN